MHLLQEACQGHVPFPTLAWLTLCFPSWAASPPQTVSNLGAETRP